MIRMIFLVTIVATAIGLPSGFVYLDDPRIIITSAYATEDNFMGRPVRGYQKKGIAIATKQAADALKKIQDELDKTPVIGEPAKSKKHYVLRVFDAYRPQQAVDHFKEWAKDLQDTAQQKKYYPNVPKNKLFALGYIAEKSGHSRGSTVDLTIVVVDGTDKSKYQDLDMGTIIDFFGPEAHTASIVMTADVQKNRAFLTEIMKRNGFASAKKEWWHFTLKDEPFKKDKPESYFNFPVA